MEIKINKSLLLREAKLMNSSNSIISQFGLEPIDFEQEIENAIVFCEVQTKAFSIHFDAVTEDITMTVADEAIIDIFDMYDDVISASSTAIAMLLPLLKMGAKKMAGKVAAFQEKWFSTETTEEEPSDEEKADPDVE